MSIDLRNRTSVLVLLAALAICIAAPAPALAAPRSEATEASEANVWAAVWSSLTSWLWPALPGAEEPGTVGSGSTVSLNPPAGPAGGNSGSGSGDDGPDMDPDG